MDLSFEEGVFLSGCSSIPSESTNVLYFPYFIVLVMIYELKKSYAEFALNHSSMYSERDRYPSYKWTKL